MYSSGILVRTVPDAFWSLMPPCTAAIEAAPFHRWSCLVVHADNTATPTQQGPISGVRLAGKSRSGCCVTFGTGDLDAVPIVRGGLLRALHS
jgi:hypothetical protein